MKSLRIDSRLRRFTMRSALSLIIAFVSLSAMAETKENRVDCKKVIDGDEIGGRFEMTLAFDSQVPSLVDSVTTTEPGKPSETTTTTHLSKKSVCGLKLDFSKDCKVKEKLDPRFGYSFRFTCGEDITFGDLYCAEKCTSAQGSGILFKCQGPKVDKNIYGDRTWEGCKFTKSTQG